MTCKMCWVGRQTLLTHSVTQSHLILLSVAPYLDFVVG